MKTETWREQAACRKSTIKQSDEFFVHEGNKQLVADLKERCNSHCPVKAECLAFADAHENSFRGTFGIYGGLTPSERIARRNGLVRVQECSTPGRRRSYDRHLSMGETPCLACEAWNDRRNDEHARWNKVRQLIREGYSNHTIVYTANVHRDTVNRLRKEMQLASIEA